VLFHSVNEASFMETRDPISRVIREGYARWTQTPSVVVYLRKDVLAPIQPKHQPVANGGLR